MTRPMMPSPEIWWYCNCGQPNIFSRRIKYSNGGNVFNWFITLFLIKWIIKDNPNKLKNEWMNEWNYFPSLQYVKLNFSHVTLIMEPSCWLEGVGTNQYYLVPRFTNTALYTCIWRIWRGKRKYMVCLHLAVAACIATRIDRKKK